MLASPATAEYLLVSQNLMCHNEGEGVSHKNVTHPSMVTCYNLSLFLFMVGKIFKSELVFFCHKLLKSE